MLTAQQIVKQGTVCLEEDSKEEFTLAPAQMGVDLHLISVDKLSGIGRIYSDEKDADGRFSSKKTELASTVKVLPYETNNSWYLEPGVYEIGFAEGCKFSNKTCGKIIHRSSVYRNGAIIDSPLFDPGFETKHMGSFMYVFQPIWIGVGARVAQMIVFESKEEAEAYNGQWQHCTVQSVGTDHEVK